MILFPIQYACNCQATILEALGLALYLTIFVSQEEREADQFGLAGSEVILLNLKDPNMPKITYFILYLITYRMWSPAAHEQWEKRMGKRPKSWTEK